MLNFLATYIDENKDKRCADVHGFIEDLKHIPKASRGTRSIQQHSRLN